MPALNTGGRNQARAASQRDHVPNGMAMPCWTPAAEERFRADADSAAARRFRDQLLVLSNLAGTPGGGAMQALPHGS